MFIMSKRNFLVRRADGTSFLIAKDYAGDIPADIYQSTVVQGALKGGLIIEPSSRSDKDIYKAAEKADKAEKAADIRKDTAKEKVDKK